MGALRQVASGLRRHGDTRGLAAFGPYDPVPRRYVGAGRAPGPRSQVVVGCRPGAAWPVVPTFAGGPGPRPAPTYRLVADGHLQRWRPGIYEPETAAFGGAASMTAAHALFIADSREAQRLRQRTDLPVGPRELSVLLCTSMMCAAALEWYEQGDVWHRVITDEHRSAINDVSADHLNARAQEIRPLLFRQRCPAAPRRAAGARRRLGRGLPRGGSGTRPCGPVEDARPRAEAGTQLPRDLPLEPDRAVHTGTEHLGLGSQGCDPAQRERGIDRCGAQCLAPAR
ncbi:thiopeptide-type bacteriocin biosynthesis protein [Streptomyces sp. NRRL F-5122]|uniref:thiopeptide-type bacteriocin biosynthesis protein n=1 Tax=Streptomyces sp. NRRL F-5122 TaxID=1609098 RepID=UPI002D219EB1|nr:thiopeptide-type bacteriocin biosynthesis protein [Streptomyces sp. NRRL F-5122]